MRNARGIVGVQTLDAARRPVNLRIVVGGDCHIDARACARQARGRDGRVLQRLPCHLEQEALLGVHGGGFARGNVEELRVELVHVAYEAAVARAHLARYAHIRIVPGVNVPAVTGCLGDGIHAVAQQRPEQVETVGVTGKSAACAHNGNRLVASAGRRIETGLQLFNGKVGAPERGQFSGLDWLVHGHPYSCASFLSSMASTSSSESAARSSAGVNAALVACGERSSTSGGFWARIRSR